MSSLSSLSNIAAKRLIRNGLTVAVAESCTGGMIGAAFTSVSGSSAWFLGGIIAYSNDIKVKVLKVPSDVLLRHGAVSSQTARAMAMNIRKLCRSDIGLATTGIAGPGGGTKLKPVGLVYIAFADAKLVKVRRFVFKGTRRSVRLQAVEAAVRMVI